MDANELREKARRSEATARKSISRLSDKRLAETWMLTEAESMSEELAVTRGWLLDELETRMGRRDVWDEMYPQAAGPYGGSGDRFEAWLFADGDSVNPLPYLT